MKRDWPSWPLLNAQCGILNTKLQPETYLQDLYRTQKTWTYWDI